MADYSKGRGESINSTSPPCSRTLSINKIPEDLRYQIRSNPNIPKTFLIGEKGNISPLYSTPRVSLNYIMVLSLIDRQ
ncbi:MAG: hypothetical protein WCH07_09270 [Deltaproteobacteria bacterium]